MTRLRDTLEVALRDDEYRPILQLCPPQWCVTDNGAVACGEGDMVSPDRIVELAAHVFAKP